MSILFLLLIAGAVYVLFFHKFTLQDGSEVKGWLAKHKAEQGEGGAVAAPQRAPKGSKGVRLVNCGNNKLAVVKAITENTTLGLKASKDAADNAPILFIAGLADDEADRIVSAIEAVGGQARVEGAIKADQRIPWGEAKEPPAEEEYVDNGEGDTSGEDNGIPSDAMGLDMDSSLDDFERVFDIAKHDLFGTGWDAMEACYGWMLLGAARENDSEINLNTIWEHISNIYAESKEALRAYYREQIEQGEMGEESLDVMPAWFANIYLLNGFNPFIVYAKNYFSDEKWDAIYKDLNRWSSDIYEARNDVPEGRDKQFYDEPNAAEFLVRLYTILMGESDDKLAANKAMFTSKYSFDFELPKVMPK